MCGSAHSKFLSSMPGGTTQSIVELQPFTRDETIAYLLSESSPNYIAGLKKTQAEHIADEYGGIPRVLYGLKQAVESRVESGQYSSIDDGLAKIKPTTVRALFELEDRFQRYCLEVIEPVAAKKEEFTRAVESWFFTDSIAAPGYGKSVLDPGLFYRNDDRVWPINNFAEELMRDKYCLYRSRKRLSECDDGKEMGAELERQVGGALLEQGRLQYSSIFSDKRGQSKEKPRKVVSLPRAGQMFRIEGNSFERVVAEERKTGIKFYRPLSSTFPRVDFLAVDYDDVNKQVYLLQTTVMSPREHLAKSAGQDWKGFFGLTDAPGKVTWMSLCKQLGLDAQNTPVDYIYITTTTEESSEERPTELPTNVDVCVMPGSSLNLLKIVI